MRSRVGLELAYGRSGLRVELPAIAHVVEPRDPPSLDDEAAALRAALRSPIGSAPLRSLVAASATVGIVVCDVTRPFPAARVLPVLLEELGHVDPARITVYVATGTHRACTEDELVRMLGRPVLDAVRVVQHDAFDASRHRPAGTVGGTSVPVLLERSFLEEEIRITTGFIEPHFFAGFSGGPKMVAPGLAALETVLELHSAARIGDERAVWGITSGNPVHDAVRAISRSVGVTFNLDVTLNRAHRITRVFAGNLFDSHAAGCGFARETAMAGVEAPFDVVVTTNSGYPLDQNLYQAVKGMSAAAQIVRPGGHIVVAAECSDGMPEHGSYKDLLRQAAGPEDFLARLAEPGFSAHDQWQVQVQALIQRRAKIHVFAGGVTAEQLRSAWMEPVGDLEATVEALVGGAGPGARLAVLPMGPQTIPYVAGAAG